MHKQFPKKLPTYVFLRAIISVNHMEYSRIKLKYFQKNPFAVYQNTYIWLYICFNLSFGVKWV